MQTREKLDPIGLQTEEEHLIIWAYKKHAKYWPAKVMSIDGQSVNVCFFGGNHSFYKREEVPVTKCIVKVSIFKEYTDKSFSWTE